MTEPRAEARDRSCPSAPSRADSDLGVMIVLDFDRPLGERSRHVRPALRGLGVPLDLVVYTPDEYRRIRTWPSSIAATADREGWFSLAADATAEIAAWLAKAEDDLEVARILVRVQRSGTIRSMGRALLFASTGERSSRMRVSRRDELGSSRQHGSARAYPNRYPRPWMSVFVPAWKTTSILSCRTAPT